MRWRVVVWVSLGVNILLAAAWLFFPRSPAARARSGEGETGITNRSKPVVLVRRQFFSWQEVESSDYPTYIANLREVGCPEQTIRDIIIADVNALFSRRQANELVTPAQQWWRSSPDTNVLMAAIQKARSLEDERRALLTRLLGTNWESGDLASLPRPSRRPVALDGPVLGALSAETKQALQEISGKSEDRLQAYLAAQRAQGKPADLAELAKLRQQTRDELARVLAPAQLEEFLLRYSQYANDLRAEFGRLKYFNPTPDEFRNIFRATDNLDQQIELLGDATDPNSVTLRQALETERENALQTMLGPKRYAEYRLLQDPLYRDAVATAQQNGTPDAVQVLYQINLAAAAEQNSILGDTNLTAEQRKISLTSLELEQLKANAIASGKDLPPEPPPTPAPTAPPRRTYTLQPGDSPAVIGIIYGVPEAAIRAANPGVNFSQLRPGDTITIPRNALAPPTTPMAVPP
jgi:LysM repeat protein